MESKEFHLPGFVALVLMTSATFGGPLASDPNAMAGWKGTVSFVPPSAWQVDMDYAVFAPGNYPDDLVNGDDPSNGTEYVYAYQAFNVSASGPATTVSIGLLGGSGAGNAGDDPLHVQTGGVSPTSSVVLLDSVVTSFTSPQLLPGQHSTVFLFTSLNSPTWMSASVSNAGQSDQQSLPSPLPEPSSLVLLAGAGLMLIRKRR